MIGQQVRKMIPLQLNKSPYKNTDGNGFAFFNNYKLCYNFIKIIRRENLNISRLYRLVFKNVLSLDTF